MFKSDYKQCINNLFYKKTYNIIKFKYYIYNAWSHQPKWTHHKFHSKI